MQATPSGAMDNLTFQPGLVSGGLLSQEEYLARKQQCTQEALERSVSLLHVNWELR